MKILDYKLIGKYITGIVKFILFAVILKLPETQIAIISLEMKIVLTIQYSDLNIAQPSNRY
jgi:hypothetical protein